MDKHPLSEKSLEERQLPPNTLADKINDKADQQTVKPLTKLVSFGDAGAACHFVDGKIICD